MDRERDRARFSHLVFELQLRGMSENKISELLGFAGRRGSRDLDIVEEDRSLKVSLSEACAILEEAVLSHPRGAPRETASVKPATASAKPVTASDKPATASVKPATASVKPATASVKPATASAKPAAASDKPATAPDKPATASVKPAHKPAVSAGGEAPTGRVADAHDGSDDRPAMSAEEVLAECKSIFGEHLQYLVLLVARRDAVPDKYVPPAWPTEDRPALSEWYRIAERANAFMTPDGKPRVDCAARAIALAEGIVRAWPRVKGADGKGKVRVWLMEGAGHFFFEVLRVLKESWPTEIDSRVEFTLVDWVVAMNTYHADAIPCAKVLAGDIHALIRDCADCALPRCVYFNYSLTPTSGTTTEGMYEPGAFPGGDYDTGDCMAATAASCSKLLEADTHLMLSFTAVRGGTETEETMRDTFGDTLATTKLKPDRPSVMTFIINKT